MLKSYPGAWANAPTHAVALCRSHHLYIRILQVVVSVADRNVCLCACRSWHSRVTQMEDATVMHAMIPKVRARTVKGMF